MLMVIIPGPEEDGRGDEGRAEARPMHPMRAKQRSVHNTYFTLPVLFAMLSNHYSMTYSAPNNWLVLALIMLAGALIRQFFVLKHKGKRDYKFFAMGAALLAAVAIWIAPSRGHRRAARRQRQSSPRSGDCRAALPDVS